MLRNNAIRNFFSRTVPKTYGILQAQELKRAKNFNTASGTKPSRGDADFDKFVQKGGFGSFR